MHTPSHIKCDKWYQPLWQKLGNYLHIISIQTISTTIHCRFQRLLSYQHHYLCVKSKVSSSSVKNYSVYIKIYETNFNMGCKSNLPNATKATNNNVTLKIICLHDRTKKYQPISFVSYDDPSTVGCCPVWHERILFLKKLGTCHIHISQDPLNPPWKLRLRI